MLALMSKKPDGSVIIVGARVYYVLLTGNKGFLVIFFGVEFVGFLVY
jgi:hypothetical protein